MTTVSMVVSCFEVMFDIHVFLFFFGDLLILRASAAS